MSSPPEQEYQEHRDWARNMRRSSDEDASNNTSTTEEERFDDNNGYPEVDPQVRANIEFLGISSLDLQGCKSMEEEFWVIKRRSADLINCSDPNIYGYASRIRGIKKAERELHEKLNDAGHEVESYTNFLE